MLALNDGRVLVRPSNVDLAEALGVKTRPEPGTYDVVVIGRRSARRSGRTCRGAPRGVCH
jgi:hypothetical protein